MNVADLEDLLSRCTPETIVTIEGRHVSSVSRYKADSRPFSRNGCCPECDQRTTEIEYHDVPERLSLSRVGEWRENSHAHEHAPEFHVSGLRRKPLRGGSLTPADIRLIRKLYDKAAAHLTDRQDDDAIEMLGRIEGRWPQ